MMGLRFYLEPIFFCSVEKVDREDSWLTLRYCFSNCCALILLSKAALMMSFEDEVADFKSVFLSFSTTSCADLVVIYLKEVEGSEGALS